MPRKDVFQKAFDFKRSTELKAAGLYPFFPEFQGYEGCPPGEIRYHDHHILMFGSNNYMGLTWDPRVREAAIQAVHRYGTGCSGSRMLNGTMDLHVRLEADLADFVGKEAALMFGTGFQTNFGALSALGQKGEVIACDRNNHASILDGLLVAFARTERYRHNDMADLAELLKNLKPDEACLIAVDGVFSMEGDLADLKGIAPLAKEYGVRLYVDEAHGIGVLGANGRGAHEHLGVQDDVDIVMATFSKSFASAGGFVAGPADVIEYIKHFSRAFVYSASMPPASVMTVQKCLDIIRSEPQRREHLLRIGQRVRDEVRALGFQVYDGITPIIPVVIGDDPVKVCSVYYELLNLGVYVNPVVPPAVAEGLLRITCMAVHTDQHVDRLLEAMKKVGKKFAFI